jgi:hypothetical protein
VQATGSNWRDVVNRDGAALFQNTDGMIVVVQCNKDGTYEMMRGNQHDGQSAEQVDALLQKWNCVASTGWMTIEEWESANKLVQSESR